MGDRLRGLAPGLGLALLLLAAGAPAPAQSLPGLDRGAEEGVAPRPIAPRSSPSQDRAIEKRLREIFGEIEGLEGVSVETQAGVVKLGGEVLSSAAREKAARIAGQLEGVVEVQEEIAETRDLDRRLRPLLAELRSKLDEAIAVLPLLGVALLLFALFLALGRLLTRWEAPYRKLARNEFARELLQNAVRVLFALAGIVLALEVLDATAVVAALAGLAGLVGLALSFAFRDLVENYIASVLLSLRQPFLAKEHVVIEGQEGHVVRLTSRATILLNPDGNHVRIPNAAVFKGTILNYSRNPRRRFVFSVGVASQTDLSGALGVGLAALQRMPGVLEDPAPQAWLASLGDWNVSLGFSGWVDQRETDWLRARGEAMRVVKESFDAAGIEMPEPMLKLRGAEAPVGAVQPIHAVPASAQTDLSPDTEIERAVAEDRARAGGDLLDASQPRE